MFDSWLRRMEKGYSRKTQGSSPDWIPRGSSQYAARVDDDGGNGCRRAAGSTTGSFNARGNVCPAGSRVCTLQ
eukprot:SM000132S26895  [mRNA]  locus=s132:224459:225063:- [translate_table: standard]